MSSSSTAHRCTCRCSGRLSIRRRRTSPFTGKNKIFGTLSKTATWRNGRLDINSFSSTSHDRDMGHLIEKEPSAPYYGAVPADYHKDEMYDGALDMTGSGSYVYGSYSADYQVTESGSMAAHNVLTVANDYFSGIDDDGEPFDLTFNYTSDRTTNGPQAYCSYRIQQIGEDAKKKVANLSVQRLVMLEINNANPRAAPGTFVITQVNTFAQDVGRGMELDQAVKAAEESAKRRGWTEIIVTPDVEFTFYVEPRPRPGQNRSGKCVVDYRIRVKMSGTLRGRPVSETHSVIGGSMWFIDDNLKTATLQGDP